METTVMKTQVVFSFLSGALLIAAQAFGQQYSYRPLDVRCDAEATSCPAGLAPGEVAAQTSARGINARGDIVGFYVDAQRKQHGFLLQDGRYSTIDYPITGVRATIANGINARGEIVGQLVMPINASLPEDSPLYCPVNLANNTADPACIKGFYLGRGGYSIITFPNHPGAIPQHITADGDIYGCLHDHDLDMSMFGAAWRRSYQGKDAVEITATMSLMADGGELSNPTADVPMSMNNGATPGARVLAGLFVMDGQQHGYLVRNGMFETYDPVADPGVTAIWDMNTVQQFVGTYRKKAEATLKRHGFVQRDNDSAPVILDVQFTDGSGNTVTAFATVAFGISPSGAIVGQYSLVSGGPQHGFIALPPGRN
jgi:probable HAF family extracellular repeat protein